MAPSRTRVLLPKLCASRSMARVRVPSPSLWTKPTSGSIDPGRKLGFFGNGRERIAGDRGCGNGNKVMVVVDSSLEAKGALEWALSLTVQNQDTVVLLFVAKPSKQGAESSLKLDLGAHEMLHLMKNMCRRRRPGVQVAVAMHEGKDRGPVIVEAANQQRASLIVLGQRKRFIIWRLMKRLAEKRNRHGGAVELHSKCFLHDNCSEEKGQKTWRLFDHHQAS